MSLEIKMGHTTYFSAHSFYSLQAGNWHSSSSMSLLLLDPEPSGAGGNLNSADLGSGLLPHPGCTRPPPPALHSVPGLRLPPPPPQGLRAPPLMGAAFSPRALSCFPKGGTFFPTAGANQGTAELWLLDTWHTLSPHLMRTPDHSGADTGATSWPQV